MKYKFWIKSVFFCSLILTAWSCQSQTNSNTSNKVSKINSNVPANNANSENQADAKIAAPQNIKFTSADNAEIIGTFYESSKAGSPAVLLLHQFGNNRKSYDEFARRLQKNNFGVLAIDGRGFGDSIRTTDGRSVTAGRTRRCQRNESRCRKRV